MTAPVHPFCQQVREYFGYGHSNKARNTSDDEDVPSSGLLNRFCARQRFNELTAPQKVARVIGGPHVKMFAGGVIAYGLATWWLGGSGVLIAGVGVLIWLISTVTSICEAVHYADLANKESQKAVASPSNALFTEASAAIGFATPMGWVILIVWDLYSLVESIGDCCSVKTTDSRAARKSNPLVNEENDEDMSPVQTTATKKTVVEKTKVQKETHKELLAE